MPGYTNPQNLNRYSYVTNNPLRYTDPTGHIQCEDYQGSCLSEKQLTKIHKAKIENIKEKSKKKNEKKEGNASQPLIDPLDSYCGDVSGLACAAIFTQDVATLIDLVGVGLIEAPVVATGCIEGGPLGCAIAEVGVWATWTVTLNNIETAASSASLALTVADDLINNGGWGEGSSTSSATWAAGLLPLTPSWDLAVDTYSSGYNHGFFNGINTIRTNGLFR